MMKYAFYQVCPLSVIVIARTSRTQSRGSVVVCRIQRSVFLISARRRHPSRISRYACTWCRTNTNSWAPKLWKLDVFAPISTWWRMPARISSISVWDFTRSMSYASTRCCRAPEPIGTKINDSKEHKIPEKLNLLRRCCHCPLSPFNLQSLIDFYEKN